MIKTADLVSSRIGGVVVPLFSQLGHFSQGGIATTTFWFGGEAAMMVANLVARDRPEPTAKSLTGRRTKSANRFRRGCKDLLRDVRRVFV